MNTLVAPQPKGILDPATGKVLVKKLRNIRSETIVQQESAYLAELRREATRIGEVELFGD
jgi:chemotaxis protein CheD